MKIQASAAVADKLEHLAIQARDPSSIQTLIFDKKKFKTVEAVKKWARDHGFKADKVDTTEDSFRLRQKAPSAFQKGSFRTIKLTNGVKAVIGRKKKQ